MRKLPHLWQVVLGTSLFCGVVGNSTAFANPIPKETKHRTYAWPISGKVTAATGEPLQGVSVIVKGTKKGTTTDANGNFTIQTPETAGTLVFSYAGNISKEVSFNGPGVIEVTLQSDNKAMSEVVVIGYGTQRKGEVTSAVASVKSKDFVKGAVKDVAQLLQGKVAGLTIGTPSGDPTSNSQILLRGTATLKTGTQPLVIIDGIPGSLNTVAPEDIEAIDVLKDGSAAAIYGTRGTNGVILITTRRAKGNIEPTIDYNVYVSTQRIAKKPDLLTGQEYREKVASREPNRDKGTSTDWVDAITRKPLTHVHNISLRGGNPKTNYIASGTVRSFQGIMQESDNRTLNGRIDLNHNMFEGKLLFNLGVLSTNNKNNMTGSGSGFDPYIYRQALNRNPTEPIRNADGSWYERPDLYLYDNPLGRINESEGITEANTTRLNGSISWLALPGLTLKAMGSQQKYNQQRGYAENKNHISNLRDKRNGFAAVSSSESSERLLELTANYNKTIGSSKFSVLGGYSYQEGDGEGSSMNNYDFPTDAFSYHNIGAGNALKVGRASMSSYKFDNNLIGFFGRVTYNFDERYLLMANLRREASSKFVGAQHPWGNFPAVSVGWRINRESFMKDFGFINDLKLRAGYGVTGTAPDASFLGLARLRYSGFFLNDGTWQPTIVPSSNPNPYLRWEEKHETNIGLDFTLLKGRVGGSIDLYNRRTKGLLYDYPVPSPPNLYGSTTANVGTMQNKGLEVMLNITPVQTKDFVWNSSLSYSANNNKLVSLENDIYKLTNNFFNIQVLNDAGDAPYRVQVGERVGNFFGYKVVDITDNGKWIYELPNGKRVDYDNMEFKQENKMILGNGLPKHYAGWNNSFRYKNFDLGVTMRGAFDFQILNNQRLYYGNPTITQYNQLRSAYDKIFGKAVLNLPGVVEWNSYYLENGDYWKIDNITFGYNFPSPSLRFIKAARIYASSLNTLTFTKYTGMDPEVTSLGLTPGLDDRDKYPSVRTFTLGVNLTF
jgi:TonB-dependent starch-binding outer membrane protein SusC